MNTEIIASPKDFLPLKDVKVLWILRYPQLSMDDDIFKSRFKKIFGKIEIRKSRQGWLGYKFEKKKTLNNEIQEFIDKEIVNNNEEKNFLSYLEVKNLWHKQKPSIECDDNILKVNIEKHAGSMQSIDGINGWNNIKLKNIVGKEIQLHEKYFIHLHNNSSFDKEERKITRSEYISFAREEENNNNFDISFTKFGILVSTITFIRKEKISSGALYFINLNNMRKYLNKQNYI